MTFFVKRNVAFRFVCDEDAAEGRAGGATERGRGPVARALRCARTENTILLWLK